MLPLDPLGPAAGEGTLKIAACFPRSVKWLFSAAEAPLPQDVEVRNMRSETAADTAAALLGQPASTPSADTAESGPEVESDDRPAASGAVPSQEAGSV